MSENQPPDDQFFAPTTWRRLLLARLAAERAYMLLQYRNLSEEILTSVPVVGSMTYKDVLLHVAAWDAVNTERLSLAVNGRFSEIQTLTSAAVAQRNAEWTAEFQSVPLLQAVATCLKERAGFLAALGRLSDEQLHKRLSLSGGKRMRPRTWARWRFLHDMAHADDLAAWRSRRPADVGRQIGPKSVLRAIVKATRHEFVTALSLIEADERTTLPVCGVWTGKDLVGHLTDWEMVGVDGLRQLADGQTPEFDYEILDFDRFNNKNAAARADQPYAQVWADFIAVRREFIELFDRLPETTLNRLVPTPWGSTLPAYVWVLVWAGHEHEHAIDVRAALNLRQWPRRLTKKDAE